jgi:HAD superfamily hydrolase (TIGR01509 family)
VPNRPIVGLTSDLWYTLVYHSPREQAVGERRRRALWSRPLVEAGWSREKALGLVLRLEDYCHAEEAQGRTVTVVEQVEWLQALGRAPFDPDAIAADLDRGLAQLPVHVARGARRVLSTLRNEGLKLGIVSNVVFETANGTRALLDREDLSRYFDAIVLSAEHPWGKPDPRIFRTCLEGMGVPADRAAHVGDRPWDVVGALVTGMRAIRFNRYRLRGDPYYWPRRLDPKTGVFDARSWGAVRSAVERMRSGRGTTPARLA